MQAPKYSIYTTTSNLYSAQNLAKTYLSRKIPLNLNITEENFEEAAEAIYDLCHFAGDELRGGKGRAGGGREDIRVALSIAVNIEIAVDFWSENARKFKNSLSVKLQKAWREDDVDTLLSVLCGIERNAATAMIDHRESELVEDIENYYEMRMGEDEESTSTEEALPEFLEELIMGPNAVQRRRFGGNQHKPRLKPTKRASKQLVMEL